MPHNCKKKKNGSLSCGGEGPCQKVEKFLSKEKKVAFEPNLKGGEDLNKVVGYFKLREKHEQRY